MRIASIALACLLLIAACVTAADKPIVGSWDCVSSTPGGGETRFTLTVKEQDGKLIGTAGSDQGEIPLTDPKFENDTFSFRVVMNSETYDVNVKVAGDKLDGAWKGGGETGAIKGNKKV